MKYIKQIAVLFFSLLLFFVSFGTVLAEDVCFTNPGTGDWALCTFDPGDTTAPPQCETTGGGGSQESYECCLSAGTSTCEAPTTDGGGGIPVTPCNAPQNVNCPANTSCVPNSTYSCNPYNVDYNSSRSSVFDGPNGNAACRLGNAQASDRSCNAWFCGYTVTTYACCPAGSVSMHYYTQPADTFHSVSQCDSESTTNCWPGTFVSWTPQTWCGRSSRDEEGNREDLYVGTKRCRPQQVRVNVCVPNCTVTAPSTPTLLSPANGSTVSTANVSLVWNNTAQTWGNSCGINNNQFEIYVGTSPSSLALIGTVGSGTGSVAFSGTSGNTYHWKIRAKNGASNTDSPVWSFTIQIPNASPWWQVKDGDVTTNGELSSAKEPPLLNPLSVYNANHESKQIN